MTELYTAPQSYVRAYVREFNAASMAEAIKLADAALRIDGVTVAVWKNRVESLSPQEQTERQIKLDTFVSLRENDIFLRSSFLLRSRRDLTVFFDLSAMDRLFIENDEFDAPLNPIKCEISSIIPLIENDILCLKTFFSKITGFTALHKTEPSSVTNIHRDSKVTSDNSNHFGSALRMIEPLLGEPTIFYENEEGCGKYILPQDSMAFFLTKAAGEKAAWHRAPVSFSHDRGLLALTCS